MEKLLTVAEVSSLLGVGKSFLYELSRPGNAQIPSIKIGKYRRWRLSDVMRYFEEKQLHKKQSPVV